MYEKKIYFWLFSFLAHKVGSAKTHKHGNAATDRRRIAVLSIGIVSITMILGQQRIIVTWGTIEETILAGLGTTMEYASALVILGK